MASVRYFTNGYGTPSSVEGALHWFFQRIHAVHIFPAVQVGKTGPGVCMVGYAVEFALECRTELGVLLSFELQDVCEPPRYQLRCARLLQRFFPRGSRHRSDEYAVPIRNRRYNSVRHIVQRFKCAAVTEFAVVSLSPKLHSPCGIHELRVDAKAASPFANAPFDHLPCAQFSPYTTYIFLPAFVGHRGVGGHHLEIWKARDSGRYDFG